MKLCLECFSISTPNSTFQFFFVSWWLLYHSHKNKCAALVVNLMEHHRLYCLILTIKTCHRWEKLLLCLLTRFGDDRHGYGDEGNGNDVMTLLFVILSPVCFKVMMVAAVTLSVRAPPWMNRSVSPHWCQTSGWLLRSTRTEWRSTPILGQPGSRKCLNHPYCILFFIIIIFNFHHTQKKNKEKKITSANKLTNIRTRQSKTEKIKKDNDLKKPD